MNRAIAKIVTEAMLAALRPVVREHGMEIRAKGGRFTDTTLEVRFEVAEIIKGVAQTAERARFAEMARFFGLQADDLDKTFQYNGDTYKIVGLNVRRRKYPLIVAREPDGKQFKFGAETAVRALGRKVTA